MNQLPLWAFRKLVVCIIIFIVQASWLKVWGRKMQPVSAGTVCLWFHGGSSLNTNNYTVKLRAIKSIPHMEKVLVEHRSFSESPSVSLQNGALVKHSQIRTGNTSRRPLSLETEMGLIKAGLAETWEANHLVSESKSMGKSVGNCQLTAWWASQMVCSCTPKG